jgi:hypothetical protein
VSRDKTFRPRFPTEVETGFHDGVLGRIRSRALGDPQPGMPEIVMVQGLTVSDYLLPGLCVLSAWTRVHLVDLPGCSGSGEPPHELAVEEFAQAIADWLIHGRSWVEGGAARACWSRRGRPVEAAQRVILAQLLAWIPLAWGPGGSLPQRISSR